MYCYWKFLETSFKVQFSIYFLGIKNRRFEESFFLFNCYLAVTRPTLGYSRGGSLTYPILITAFVQFRHEGHRVSCNEVGSLSPAKYLVDKLTILFALQEIQEVKQQLEKNLKGIVNIKFSKTSKQFIHIMFAQVARISPEACLKSSQTSTMNAKSR